MPVEARSGVATSGQDQSGEKLKVFISYSRKDADFARELLVGLQLVGFEPYLDQRDIAAGEVWEERLGHLIEAADTVVFVLSPDAAASDRCAWEVNRAIDFKKRLLPVVLRQVDEAQIPSRLKQLNYIFFDRPFSFAASLQTLSEALRTDVEWIRENTRIGELALRWNRRNRATSLLLRGEELAAATKWRDAQPRYAPEPTLLILDFINASQDDEAASRNSERQRLADMSQMQEDRQKALDHIEKIQQDRIAALNRLEENLRQKARAQASRARGSLYLSFLAIMALVALILDFGGLTSEQRLGIYRFLFTFFCGLLVATFVGSRADLPQNFGVRLVVYVLAAMFSAQIFLLVTYLSLALSVADDSFNWSALMRAAPWALLPFGITLTLCLLARVRPTKSQSRVRATLEVLRDGVITSIGYYLAYCAAIILLFLLEMPLPPALQLKFDQAHILPIPMFLQLQIIAFFFGALLVRPIRQAAHSDNLDVKGSGHDQMK